MGIEIDELIAQVEAPATHSGASDVEPRLNEEQPQQNTLDLLHLIQERKARLVID